MYTSRNFLTKKALKEAVARGETVTLWQPGPFDTGRPPASGTYSVEGPHYPQPHTWYARVTVQDSRVVKVQ